MTRAVASPIPAAVVVLVCAVLALLATGAAGGQEDGHRFKVRVGEATNVVVGQSIRQSGSEVGRVVAIDPVNGGRDAELELEVDDEAWPLPAGTRLQLRWGGTANFGNRYIAIRRGTGRGSAVSDGGTFATADFDLPVEFDELLATFPETVRADLRRFLNEGGEALAASRTGLRRTLRWAPAALEEASTVLADVNADQRAVRTLVRSTDRVVGAIDSAQPGLRELIAGAGETFDAIADEADGLTATLDAAPSTMRAARATLRRADPALEHATSLVTDIAPGVTAVRRAAAPLDSLLRTVDRIGPDAKATLASARAAAPDLDPLLSRLEQRGPQFESIGRQAVANLECIRPYTPEANAFFSNWGDFFSGTDGKDKLIRAQVQYFAPTITNAAGYNSGQAAKFFPGLEYGFPRPPGYLAGQPWYLPECGAGTDALDPQKDPEIRPAQKLFDMPELSPLVPLPEAGR